jgi:DNA polymerase-3 subunit epsilon
MRQIILDTETTGLRTEDGHRIIEIGCLEMINRKLTGNCYHQYLNPQRDIDEAALLVHGITPAFLADKPVFSDISDELMEFIQGAELIIHNAPFDIGFLNYEFSLTKQKWKPISHYCRVIDTLVLARQLHVGQRNSLDALCKRYGVDNSDRDLHGALLDAHLLAQVYLAMTGGQGSLFDELLSIDAPTIEETTVFMNTPPVSSYRLRVIFPDEEELQAHEDYLKKMTEKGKCLWFHKSC